MTLASNGGATIAAGKAGTMGLSAHLAKALEERGLDVELMVKHGVSGSARGYDWIEIPYIEAGRRVNTKFRTVIGEKKFSQDAGGKKCFWNADVLTDPSLSDQPIIITEGEFDAFAALQSGFARVVSVPDGAPSEAQGPEDTGSKYSYVTDAPSALRTAKEIILATDADGPGVNLMNDLAIRLGKPRCKTVKYPDGCKDLNDVLLRQGERGVVEVISRAQWSFVGGLYKMSELPPIQQFVAYPIGIEGLENHYKMRAGDLTVITGIPGHGKTAFVNEVAARMALTHRWKVAVASFEQRPQVDHKRALRTFYNRRYVIHQHSEDIARADRWIDDHFVFIVPGEDDEPDLHWVRERCVAAALQHGCRLLIIDPWNEMDHTRPSDMTLTEYTGFAIKQLKKLAAAHHVHVIVVAHPAKMHRTKEGGIPVPSLYDISDSAHWANKPDVGIVVHREDVTKPDATIRIIKSRYVDAIGRPGVLNAVYVPEQARFEIVPSAPT